MTAPCALHRLLAVPLLLALAAPAAAQPTQPRPPSSEPARDLRAEAEAERLAREEAEALRAEAAVNPSRPTHTDNALFIVPGAIELEAGYRIDRDRQDLDDVNTLTLVTQHIDFLARLGLAPTTEARFGWNVLHLLAVDGNREESGLGDPFAQLKHGIPVDPDGTHLLALLVTASPGIGQSPFTHRGLGLGADAVYTVFPGPLQLDAQAGLHMVLLVDNPQFRIPLSGVVSWSFLPTASVFGEFVQRLNLNRLNDSGTSLLAGGAWHPLPRLAVDASFGLGLSPSEPGVSFLVGATWLAGFLP
ncbi:MAG: hypothetical protein EA398_02925 [Deltaproteobacteria bacterium]|nr:MAG: hypothetical protein EA398_02925 [Deltaproteobacteria bacterium]